MKPSELLKPGAWNKWHSASSSDGRAVTVRSNLAVAFCLTGAIERVAYLNEHTHEIELTNEQGERIYKTTRKHFEAVAAAIKILFPKRAIIGSDITVILEFNDHPDTTFQDVHEVLKLALL